MSRSKRTRTADAGPWIFLLAGLVLTVAASIQAVRNGETDDSTRLANLLERSRTSIETRLLEHLALIRATASFIASTERVDRAQYNDFARGTGIVKYYPGATVLGFALAESSDTSGYAKAMLIQNPTRLWPVARPPRARTMRVLFSAPETESSRRIIGFDMFGTASRRPYLVRAVETGDVVFTPPLELVRTTQTQDPFGFLMYQAAYTPGQSLTSPAERWRALRGVVYSPFRANVFFHLSLRDPEFEAINIRITDENRGTRQILYDSARSVATGAKSQSSPVGYPTQSWQIEVTPTPAFYSGYPRRFVPLVPILGAILTGLAFSLAWAQSSARRRSEADAMRLRTEVTERQRVEIEVRRLNEKLEATVETRTQQLRLANQEMEAFVYSVSHDLRAPLRAIDGFSQVVLEDYGDRIEADGRDALARVRRASGRMDSLITALLTLSRVSKGEIRSQPLDLTQMVVEAFDLVVHALEPGSPVPRLTVEPGLRLTGDERLLHIALVNLIGNAVKFSQNVNEPLIEVGREGEAIFVRDNGVGFNPAHAEKLFQPFERLHPESEFAGTGIGLATVQRIIRRHGGEIWAESSPGHGAKFLFTVPGSA